MNEQNRPDVVPQHLEAITLKVVMAVVGQVSVPLSMRVARLVEDTLRDLVSTRVRQW